MSLSKQLTADSSHRAKGGNKEREKDKQSGQKIEKNMEENSGGRGRTKGGKLVSVCVC